MDIVLFTFEGVHRYLGLTYPTNPKPPTLHPRLHSILDINFTPMPVSRLVGCVDKVDIAGRGSKESSNFHHYYISEMSLNALLRISTAGPRKLDNIENLERAYILSTKTDPSPVKYQSHLCVNQILH